MRMHALYKSDPAGLTTTHWSYTLIIGNVSQNNPVQNSTFI